MKNRTNQIKKAYNMQLQIMEFVVVANCDNLYM